MIKEPNPQHKHEWNPDLTNYEKATEYEALLSLDQDEDVELRRYCLCGIHERATLSKWKPAFRDTRLSKEEREEIHESCKQLDFVQSAPDELENFLRFRRCVDEAMASKLQAKDQRVGTKHATS